jgi:hypothetical protein
MDTACKNCIFSEKVGNTQMGCSYGNIERFKKVNCEIIEAEDEADNFFVIKNRLCMALRVGSWGSDLTQEEKILKVRKDITTKITCILIIKKETSSIDDVLDTFKSAISQKTSFDSIHFIIEKGASIKIGSLMNSIKKIDCNVKWFVKQLVHDDFSYKHGIDEIVEKLKSVFSAVFVCGFKIPDDFVYCIDTSINEELNRFIILKPVGENGTVVQNKSFNLFGGNREAINDLDSNKFMSISEKIDYIAKDQNLNHLIQDIVSICPSMNQK